MKNGNKSNLCNLFYVFFKNDTPKHRQFETDTACSIVIVTSDNSYRYINKLSANPNTTAKQELEEKYFFHLS